jgi:creatinine amidohydrolase/Fe(II)-dependent formamide hydrolase-like protein
LLPMVGASQILDVRDLTAVQIASLDRQRTAVILQGGILEEHGPYLPIYSDGWMNEYMTRQLADALVARPGWKVLIFPVLPLGSGGANELAGKRSFAGTFAVRPATLRSVYMDLADELGLQGFRWIFLMNAHGAPSHSRALFDACDYFRDTYGGSMVHLWGLAPMGQWFQDSQQLWNEEARKENGFLVHGDMLETSYLLFLRPSAIQAGYSDAPSYGSSTMGDVLRAAERPDWPGYVGAPRFATAARGAQALRDATGRITQLVTEILAGRDARSIPRRDEVVHSGPEQEKVDAAATSYDAALEKKQDEWLRKRKQ